jgi:hypothetical protein
VRPALPSEPQNNLRPVATNFISPSHSSQSGQLITTQLTDPEGSTGVEIVASLRAYVSTATAVIDAELTAINALDIINEDPIPTEDDVSGMTPF